MDNDRANDLLREAKLIFDEAVKLDNSRSLNDAADKYSEGIDILKKAFESIDKTHKRYDDTKTFLSYYEERLEQLKDECHFNTRDAAKVLDGAEDEAERMENLDETEDELDREFDCEQEQNFVDFEDFVDFDEDEMDFSEDQTADSFREHNSRMLMSASEKTIQFLTSCSIARSSDSGTQKPVQFDRSIPTDFDRLCTSLDETVAKEARTIWTSHKHVSSTFFFCNRCGNNTGRLDKCHCGGVVIKYVRTGSQSQVRAIVETHFEDIVKLHGDVRAGKELLHNLSAPFFRQLPESEDVDQLLLSSILSVDGVCVKGCTKKLWPVSLFLVDLPTCDMQRSTNIVLCGIAEGSENPSTSFWNSVFPMILGDVESADLDMKSYKIRNSIVSFVGDQMVGQVNLSMSILKIQAKRPFFGVKGHSSAKSCFYCLSEGTLYKEYGPERYMERPGELTIDDAKSGQNGFGECYSVVNEYLRISDTPIDILHVFGEGIYERIVSELCPLTRHTPSTRKSQLFMCDRAGLEQFFSQVILPHQYRHVIRRRNGSDKITYFRSYVLLASLACEVLSAECRFTLLALSLLTCKMYTESNSSSSFYMRLTTAARHFLMRASPRYLSIKAHEGLFHLAYSSQRLGNNASLSTFAFESFYQYALSGFSSRKTRGFVEGAADRVLLHGSLRRELKRRLQETPSQALSSYCSLVPDLVVPSEQMQSKIPQRNMRPEDAGKDLHSDLTTKFGKFVSPYKDTTESSAFFFDRSGAVFRFLGAFEDCSRISILAEEVISLSPSERYLSLCNLIPDMSNEDAAFGTKIMEQLVSFGGVVHGKLSGNRCVFNSEEINGQCGRVEAGSGTIFIKLNGAAVHN